ncbi:hypothetical protein CAPN009_14520 [Capnocytophaga canimorsus]|nr:hypothetical protein CAPN009_14520 [Capnocytophaga canimorsus]
MNSDDYFLDSESNNLDSDDNILDSRINNLASLNSFFAFFDFLSVYKKTPNTKYAFGVVYCNSFLASENVYFFSYIVLRSS